MLIVPDQDIHQHCSCAWSEEIENICTVGYASSMHDDNCCFIFTLGAGLDYSKYIP